MTEAEALAWLERIDVPHGTLNRLEQLVARVRDESKHQNLVSETSLAAVWARHIVDSLQLLCQPADGGGWVDIGSGAGFPGLAVACASDRDMTLIEPRRLRANFLTETARSLGVSDRVQVLQADVERVPPLAAISVISARGVAPLTRLFELAGHLATSSTTWLLMKGAKARDELAEAQRSWQGDFQLVPSITDEAASIVVARNVKRRG